MENRSFEDLETWKHARLLKLKIRNLVSTFPPSEEYILKRQIIRSSRSITANIAEGWGRFHFQENIQFCRQARGSLYETLDHLIEAQDCGYLKQDLMAELRKDFDQSLKLINGYISYLNRQKDLTSKPNKN